MTDLVLDVGALADVLTQLLAAGRQDTVRFRQDRFIPNNVADLLNRNVRSGGQYLVVASALAFVELAHKWGEIVNNRFHPRQLAAFLADPPDWFVVASIDRTLIPSLCAMPAEVVMPNGRPEPIEWTDAIHAATALSREQATLVTTDSRLRQIPNLSTL